MIEPLPLPLSLHQVDHLRRTRADDPDVVMLIREIERLQYLCDDVEESFDSPFGDGAHDRFPLTWEEERRSG